MTGSAGVDPAQNDGRRFVGIDLGARRLHVATLVAGVATVDVVAPADVVAACDGAERIAIDAPSDPATGRVHPGAPSPKFALARCGEIAAGEQLGVWVPWVTPTVDDAPGWMRTGFAVWAALRAAGHEPIEVYPAGCFWLRNGRRWPPRKATPAGRAARLSLLGATCAADGHDAVDAVMAAEVAADPGSIRAGHDDPGCDGSAIWFPSLDG